MGDIVSGMVAARRGLQPRKDDLIRLTGKGVMFQVPGSFVWRRLPKHGLIPKGSLVRAPRGASVEGGPPLRPGVVGVVGG